MIEQEVNYGSVSGTVFDCLPVLSADIVYATITTSSYAFVKETTKKKKIDRPTIENNDTCKSVEEMVNKTFEEYQKTFPGGFPEGKYFWEKLLQSLCAIESNCNNTAISDDGGALGMYQIRQIFLTDAVESICEYPHFYGLTKDSPAHLGACAAMQKLKHRDVLDPNIGKRLAEMLIKIWLIRYFGSRQPGETIQQYMERIAKRYHGSKDPVKNQEYWEKFKKQFFNPSYPSTFPPLP
jgi:hypothetical protein